MSQLSQAGSEPWLNAIGSRYFLDWLHEQRCSLAFTTYQTGKLFLVGCKSLSGAGVPTSDSDRGYRSSNEPTTTVWECVPRPTGKRSG
jgi:hypothetical protein